MSKVEVILTDQEKAIKAYLSNRDPLSPEILDMVLKPYWEQEPYRQINTHTHYTITKVLRLVKVHLRNVQMSWLDKSKWKEG